MKKNTNNSLYSTVQSTILRGVDMMDFFCENVLTSIEHERWLDRIFMVTRWVSERPNQVGRSLMALGHLAPRFYALPGPSDQFFYHIFFSSFSFVTKASSWFYQFHRKKTIVFLSAIMLIPNPRLSSLLPLISPSVTFLKNLPDISAGDWNN